MANPAILTVDDDPAVSRAVARDLRRRYGERYRIVRADSGAEALDALREIKLRGEQVAVLLADYRMPQMNGIEFLEAAMDLFPHARRVLLTAYADTDAAIDAINVVDVDHYLLKPWDPPEEKLYPVIDALLEAWAATPDAAGDRDPGRRAPLVGAVVRGPRLPGPQPGAVPLVRVRRAGGRAAARRGRADRGRRAAGGHRRGQGAGRADRRRAGRRRRAVHRRRPRTSTTWSSSAAARPGSAPRSTAPPRGCAPCWSSGAPPAGRPGRAAASRTTWASPTASPARSSPTGPAGRRCKFGAELLTTREVVGLERARLGPGAPVRRRQRDRRAHGRAGHRRRRTGCSTRPGSADLTGRGRLLRLGRHRGAELRRRRTSTSSAAPTPPGRRRCTSPGTPSGCTMLVRGRDLTPVDVAAT